MRADRRRRATCFHAALALPPGTAAGHCARQRQRQRRWHASRGCFLRASRPHRQVAAIRMILVRFRFYLCVCAAPRTCANSHSSYSTTGHSLRAEPRPRKTRRSIFHRRGASSYSKLPRLPGAPYVLVLRSSTSGALVLGALTRGGYPRKGMPIPASLFESRFTPVK